MPDYMGTSDAAKLTWMQGFKGALQANPSAYFVGSADLASIMMAIDAFAAALAISSAVGTRTKTTISLKDDLRSAAAAICRQYVRLIKWNAGISDQAKIDAGIKPPTIIVGEDRACPVSSPIISVTAATNGAHTLTYVDSLDQYVRRKPAGADGLLLFRAIAAAPVTDVSQMHLYRKYTTSPMPVFFDAPENGKIASYVGRWIGQRGDMSTPSPAVSMPIAA
jgi:hypothetical protein